jgi:hypothetical protein
MCRDRIGRTVPSVRCACIAPRLEPVIDVMDAVAIELQAMAWRESLAASGGSVRST